MQTFAASRKSIFLAHNAHTFYYYLTGTAPIWYAGIANSEQKHTQHTARRGVHRGHHDLLIEHALAAVYVHTQNGSGAHRRDPMIAHTETQSAERKRCEEHLTI